MRPTTPVWPCSSRKCAVWRGAITVGPRCRDILTIYGCSQGGETRLCFGPRAVWCLGIGRVQGRAVVQARGSSPGQGCCHCHCTCCYCHWPWQGHTAGRALAGCSSALEGKTYKEKGLSAVAIDLFSIPPLPHPEEVFCYNQTRPRKSVPSSGCPEKVLRKSWKSPEKNL